MSDVCHNKTNSSYAKQRTGYAKSQGHDSIKNLVKEKILENWTDGDCSNDNKFDLSGLKKENITLSDVAAAMGDIFDKGSSLKFQYTGSHNVWGRDGLVETLKTGNGNNCDVRELNNIDLSNITGECDDSDSIKKMSDADIQEKIFENKAVLEKIKHAADRDDKGFQYKKDDGKKGPDFNAMKEMLNTVLTKELGKDYHLSDAAVFAIGDAFDATKPNKTNHSAVKNHDGWLGLGEAEGALDTLNNNSSSGTVTTLDAARVAELKADPEFRKLMADKLLTNGQIAAVSNNDPDPMTWGRDLTEDVQYASVNDSYLKPVLEAIDPDNTYNLDEASIQLLADALSGNDSHLTPNDFKTEIEVVKKERVNKAHDELLKSKPFAKFILSQAKNERLTEQNILDYLDGEVGLDMDPSMTGEQSPFDYLRTQDVNLYGLGNTESSLSNKDSWEKLGDKLFDTIRYKSSGWLGFQSSYLTKEDAQAHLDSLDD